MWPYLVETDFLLVNTYGVILTTGFALAILWTVHESTLAGLERRAFLNLVFLMVLAAGVGSRLLYVALAWKRYQAHPLDALLIWQGGFVFYGGLLLCILLFLILVPRWVLPFWRTADAFAPGLALGEAVGRLGCLAAGCCYGRPTDLPWGLTFSHPECLAPLGKPLHPTQLYTSILMATVFLVLVSLRKGRWLKPGQLFWSYGLLHGTVRLLVEYFRGDNRGLLPWWGWTWTQAAAVVLITVSLLMLGCLKRK